MFSRTKKLPKPHQAVKLVMGKESKRAKNFPKHTKKPLVSGGSNKFNVSNQKKLHSM